MSDATDELVERLLDEFVARLRRGESPSVAEYAAAHPACAAEIRELFSAAEMMERLAERRTPGGAAPLAAAAAPERLGDFRIIREIGRGGMGVVYEAQQESLSRRVAVKVLPQAALRNPTALGRFEREARTAAQLHHTNIVPVFGVGEDRGFHFIAMQLIHGVGLDKVLGQLVRGRLAPSDATAGEDQGDIAAIARGLAAGKAITTPPTLGPRYWQSVARVGAQVADALHYAHQRGTLHRDIKPANLLVDGQGTVWITDFGLAKAMEHDDVSRTGDIVGTLRYMAPERFHGEADARSDVYSLGLTLYELLTLRPAYEPSSPSVLMRRIVEEQPPRPRALNPAIPADLETIVLKAVAREPVHRYASAEELADDLRCFLEDRPILARRLGPVERLWRWARRNRVVAGLVGLAATLLVLVALVATIGYVRTSRANARVREALAGQSQERQKAEAISTLTLEALDDIFEQYVPNRVAGAGEMAIDDAEGSAVRLPVQPVLSPGAAALLERMLVFYERLAQQNVADAGLRREIADANRRVGDIHRRLGHVAEAQAAYLKAIEGYRQLPHAATDDSTVATEIARIYNELGDLRWTTRGHGDGRLEHAQAMEILKSLPADQAAPAAARYELARTHYFLGRGHPPEAVPGRGPQNDRPDRPGREPPPGPSPAPSVPREDEENLRQAIAILERLIGQQPATADYRHLLACCYRDLPAAAPKPTGESEFAAADKAIEILRKLAADFPGVPDYRFDLSKTYAKLDLRDRRWDADFCRVAGDRLQQSRRIAEKLVAENPNVPEYAASEAHGLYALAEVLRHDRRPDEAETTLRKALALQSSLAEQFPRVAAYVVWKAILQESLAKLLSDRGRAAEARTLLDSAVKGLAPLCQSESDAAYIHGILGRCYRNLSDALRTLGDDQQADEMLRQGRGHRR